MRFSVHTAPLAHAVLQQRSDKSIAEQGRAGTASCSGRRAHSADTNSWRITPSVCSDLISDRDNVWSIRAKLKVEGQTRDLAMFNLAIDSKLRGRDIVSLKVADVAPHGLALDRPCLIAGARSRHLALAACLLARLDLDLPGLLIVVFWRNSPFQTAQKRSSQ
jgi:hypothetical protein